MKEENIPTARFEVFTNLDNALEYTRAHRFPLVIKASGLALAKGVVVAENIDEAESALGKMMREKIYGDAGSEVVIEEYLEGREISIHAFCDGETAILWRIPYEKHTRLSPIYPSKACSIGRISGKNHLLKIGEIA